MYFFKSFLVLLCTFTLTLAQLDVIKSLISLGNNIPVRVRTVEELRARSNESVVLDFIGLVEQYSGYSAKEYNITTDDGYILGLHRINGSPKSPIAKGKPVVYIQHGLFGSSDFFVLLGPEQTIAFQLADAGYDVWLGNVRGNTYSRSHQNYSADDYAFWDFSMDDMAEYDISKFIDIILEKTEQKKLTFIGYSMGTTISFMLLSSKPEYNEKINLLVSLAPVVYFKETDSFIKKFISNIINMEGFLYHDEVLPQSAAFGKYGKESCNDTNSANFCKVFLAAYATIADINVTAIPDIVAHIPAGTSFNTLEHYNQLVNSDGKLQKFSYVCTTPGCRFKYFFDFGRPTNNDKYGSDAPPEYDVSLIIAPHAVFYGAHDVFVNVKNVNYLKDKLQNIVIFEQIPDENFNHLDFAFSIKARSLVYNRVLQVIYDNS